MKTDSVARFEFNVDKAISCAECLKEGAIVDKDVLLRVLGEGRRPAVEIYTPTKPCGCLVGHKCAGDKKDTIEISREDAEYLLDLYERNTKYAGPTLCAIAYRIKQALSEVRT